MVKLTFGLMLEGITNGNIADHIDGFNVVKGMLLIWAVCSSMIYGIGFKPRHWFWQVTFSPYFSITILTSKLASKNRSRIEISAFT